MKPQRAHAELLRQSRLAVGVAFICLLFGIETAVAHQVRPNPASVWVWSALAAVGGASMLAWFRLRRQCRQASDRPGAPPPPPPPN